MADRTDLTGRQFGRLTAVSRTAKRSSGYIVWICRCSCGAEKEFTSQVLRRGTSTHCGCAIKRRRLDLTGQRFGILQAVAPVGSADGSVLWSCLCDCGRTTAIAGKSLKQGGFKSCGCRRTEGLPAGVALRNIKLQCYKDSAGKRKLSWDLDDEYALALFASDCHYCGIEPTTRMERRRKTGHIDVFLYNGIDRFDNSIGYTVSNAVPCCKTCNIAKNAMGAEEFLEWIERVHGNQKKQKQINELKGSSNLMKVYLCGGINGLSDDQCVTWREKAKNLLECETLDPMRRDFRGREDDCVNDIVMGDKADIKSSSLLLVNAEKPSWGTAMEMVYAFTARKPIVVVCPSDQVSPWLRFHATKIVKSLEEACALINSGSIEAAACSVFV